jgi:hypothetical protein
MAVRQDQQHERLLTLLENRRRSTPAQTYTVTTITQSDIPAAGIVSIIPPRNYVNLAMAGISLPPMLRFEGRIMALDTKSLRSDLDSSTHEILEEASEPLRHRVEGTNSTLASDKPQSVLEASPLLPLDEDDEDNKRLLKYIKRNNSIKTKTGIPIKWFLMNRICINFNIGSCIKTTNHLNTNKKLVLRHICGICLLHKRASDTTHTAVTCQHKPQIFH